MASANVALVRSFGTAWERGDFPGMAECVHPEIEFVVADGPEAGTWVGWARMAEVVGEYLGMWEDYRFVADEFRELDDERVLVLGRFSGRGRTSRLELTRMRTMAASVFYVRGGKVTKLVRYWDGKRGLADLGLAPEADSPAS